MGKENNFIFICLYYNILLLNANDEKRPTSSL